MRKEKGREKEKQEEKRGVATVPDKEERLHI